MGLETRPQGYKRKVREIRWGSSPGVSSLSYQRAAPACLPIELMTQTCDTGCQFHWPNNDRLRTEVDKITEHESGLNHGF